MTQEERPPRGNVVLILVLAVAAVAAAMVVWYAMQGSNENVNTSANQNENSDTNSTSVLGPDEWTSYEALQGGIRFENPGRWYVGTGSANPDIVLSAGTFSGLSIMSAEPNDVVVHVRLRTGIADLNAYLEEQDRDFRSSFPSGNSSIVDQTLGGKNVRVWYRDSTLAQDIPGIYQVLYFQTIGDLVLELSADARNSAAFMLHRDEIETFVASATQTG